MENITDKPLYALEEQLSRQKGILANRLLIQKLPDKGAKLTESVAKIELEIEKRKAEKIAKTTNISLKDVGKMEWTLSSSGKSDQSDCASASKALTELDSDDDQVEVSEEERTLQIVATSQISQRQSKPEFTDRTSAKDTLLGVNEHPSDSEAIMEDKVKLDKYVARLVGVDATKPCREKYVPGKTRKDKPNPSPKTSVNGSGSPSPAEPSPSKTSSGRSTPTTTGKSVNKWDECLLPPTRALEAVKFLPLDESIKISEEKYKREEEIAASSKSARKKYAYDRLQEEGTLGSFTVEMQVSRPVRTDPDDGSDLDEDVSDDHLTEDSESEEDDVNNSESNQKTSKDLSNLLNASLKLNNN